MLPEPRTNFGHNVPDTDDFTIGITDDGTKRVVRHEPSGKEMVFGPDGFETPAVDTDEISTTLYAEPGNVQSQIDALETAGVRGKVVLHSQETYDPAATWQLKPSVTLDFNGAQLVPTTDHDLISCHPDTVVKDPVIDLNSVAFTSSVFVLDTANGDYNKDETVEITGGKTDGSYGEGTVFYLHESQGTGFRIEAVETTNHVINGCNKCVDLHAEGGYINVNNFKSPRWQSFDVAIHHRGVGSVSANYYHVHTSPQRDSTTSFFVHDNGGSFNQVRGMQYDVQYYTGDFAFWSANAGPTNKIFVPTLALAPVTNNSGDPTNCVVRFDSVATNNEDNFIGWGSDISRTAGPNQVAIGDNTTLGDQLTTAIGAHATTSSIGDTAVGASAEASGTNSVAVGRNTVTTGGNSVAIGFNVTNSVRNTALIKGNVKYDRVFVDSASSTSYTTTQLEEIVGVDTNTAAVTVTLDSTSGNDEGHHITVNDEGGNAATNNITVDVGLNKTIDGGASVTINTNYGSVECYSDGTDWFTK